jgi:hypothetical protein
MIRSFLVLALLLAISAASLNIAADAGFDVDDVDFKEKKVIECINQFHGNRRKMLNNAFRDLAVTQTCKDETEVILGSDDFTKNIVGYPDAVSECELKGTTHLCDVKYAFAGVQDSCEEAKGQVVSLKTTIVGESGHEYVANNMLQCIGASCDAGEFVKLMQDQLDALYKDRGLYTTYTVESESKSGALSTRMHYVTAVASALAMLAGVTFLN